MLKLASSAPLTLWGNAGQARVSESARSGVRCHMLPWFLCNRKTLLRKFKPLTPFVRFLDQNLQLHNI